MGASPRPAGLRLFQSQHTRQQGRRLLYVPRGGGQHAADVSGRIATDGVVLAVS